MPSPNLPPTLADVIRLTLIGRDVHTSYWQTVLYYLPTSALPDFTSSFLQNFLSAWSTNCLTEFRALLTTAADVTHLKAESMRLASQQPEYALPGLSGTAVGETLPPHVALTFQKKTAVRGRKGRGSNRIPCIPEEGQVDGFIIPAYKSACITFADQVTDPISILAPQAGTFVVGLAKQDVYDPQTGKWSLLATPLLSFAVNDALGSQNTRKIGRGI